MMKALVSTALRLTIISKMGQETMYNYIVFEMKESCGIKLEQRLENKAVEKESLKGDIPQVAMDLQVGASVYDYGMPATC